MYLKKKISKKKIKKISTWVKTKPAHLQVLVLAGAAHLLPGQQVKLGVQRELEVLRLLELLHPLRLPHPARQYPSHALDARPRQLECLAVVVVYAPGSRSGVSIHIFQTFTSTWCMNPDFS